jgi:WD40 repeat protein
LTTADLIILLISADYWSSNYASREELTVAIERGKSGAALVLPIICKPCLWQHLPIAEFSVLPADSTPLSEVANMDVALAEITNRIYELARDLNAKRAAQSASPLTEGEKARDLLSPDAPVKKPEVTLIKYFPHPHRVLDAAFNRTGTKFATVCDDGRVRVFSVQDLQQEMIIHSRPQSLQSVSWSRTGREIATGDSDGSVRIWRDSVEVRVLPAQTDSILDAEYSLEGSEMAVASEDGFVSLWNPRRPRLIWRRKVHEGSVNSVRFSAKGNHIVTSSTDGTAVVLDATNGHEVSRFAGHEDKVSISVFVSTQLDQEIACVSSGADGKLLLWSVTDPERYTTITTHAFWVRAMTCSLEGDFVVSGGYDSAIKFIDLHSGHVFESASADQGPIYCVRLSMDGALMLVSAEDCNAYLFWLRR